MAFLNIEEKKQTNKTRNNETKSKNYVRAIKNALISLYIIIYIHKHMMNNANPKESTNNLAKNIKEITISCSWIQLVSVFDFRFSNTKFLCNSMFIREWMIFHFYLFFFLFGMKIASYSLLIPLISSATYHESRTYIL